LGNVKNQKSVEKLQDKFNFPIVNQMKIIGAIYFKFDYFVSEINKNRTDKIPDFYGDLSP